MARGLAFALLGIVPSACEQIGGVVPGLDPRAERSVALASRYGCVACHEIPGASATGYVGPPLHGVRRRAYLAGGLPNTPEAMVALIRFPDRVRPGTVMPNLRVSETDARELAAFLYALR